MDDNLMWIVLASLAAVVLLVVAFRYNKRLKLKGKAPEALGAGEFELEAEGHEPAPAALPAAGSDSTERSSGGVIRADKLVSRKGGLSAHEKTGGQIKIGETEVEGDIDLSVSKGDDSPKA